MITHLFLRTLVMMVSSCRDCPLQEVPHCSTCWTITQLFVDITPMFFMLGHCWLLLVMMATNLNWSLSSAVSPLSLVLLGTVAAGFTAPACLQGTVICGWKGVNSCRYLLFFLVSLLDPSIITWY